MRAPAAAVLTIRRLAHAIYFHVHHTTHAITTLLQTQVVFSASEREQLERPKVLFDFFFPFNVARPTHDLSVERFYSLNKPIFALFSRKQNPRRTNVQGSGTNSRRSRHLPLITMRTRLTHLQTHTRGTELVTAFVFLFLSCQRILQNHYFQDRIPAGRNE